VLEHLVPRRRARRGTVTEPVWTDVDGSQATCGSCHGLPPPAPHSSETTATPATGDGEGRRHPRLAAGKHLDGVVDGTDPHPAAGSATTAPSR
jgi:hypothetical protein